MSDNTPDKEQVELSPIQWMDKAIQSLYVQLPESVANDVSKRWEVVKIYLIGKVKDAFYYRDGHPRDGYLWSQFNSAHDLAASARYHQEPVTVKKAIDVLTKAIKDDPGYYYGWQSNIAMAFYDEYNEMIKEQPEENWVHIVSNNAAKRFLNGLANISEPASPVAERDERLVWVKASERLPEKSTPEKMNKVMIVCKPLGISTGHYWGEQHIGSLTNGWDIMDVTHWMPLPLSPGETPSHEGKEQEMNDFFLWWKKNGYNLNGLVFEKNTGHDDFELYTPGELYNLYTESLKQQK